MTGSSLKKLIRLFLGLGLLGILLAVFLPSGKDRLPPMNSLINFQKADAAPGYVFETEDGELVEPGFDPRLMLPSAFDAVRTPTAVHFTAPLGSQSGALSYNAQPFMAMNEGRGGKHSGDDLNGIGGMNTDLGDPVYAIGDGRVLFAGQASPGWGKVILLSHRLDGGKSVQSMYAHLKDVRVRAGELVHRGRVIGSVGTADGAYLAHLHFEMRAADTVDVLRGYLADQGVHLDPSRLISRYQGALTEPLPPSALGILRESILEADRLQLKTSE